MIQTAGKNQFRRFFSTKIRQTADAEKADRANKESPELTGANALINASVGVWGKNESYKMTDSM